MGDTSHLHHNMPRDNGCTDCMSGCLGCMSRVPALFIVVWICAVYGLASFSNSMSDLETDLDKFNIDGAGFTRLVSTTMGECEALNLIAVILACLMSGRTGDKLCSYEGRRASCCSYFFVFAAHVLELLLFGFVVLAGVFLAIAFALFVLFLVMETVCDASESVAQDAVTWLNDLFNTIDSDENVSIPNDYCNYVEMDSLSNVSFALIIVMVCQVMMAMLAAKLTTQIIMERKLQLSKNAYSNDESAL